MVWPTSAGSLDIPSPPWNGKGPDAYKDKLIPINASSFSRLSHLISSAITIVIIVIAVGVLPPFLLLQLLLLLPLLVLLRLPQPLALSVIRHPHGQIPRQRHRVIYEDEVPRLVLPFSKLVLQGQEIN